MLRRFLARLSAALAFIHLEGESHMDTRPSLSFVWIDRFARLLRFFPALVLAVVLVFAAIGLSEFFTETAQQLFPVESTVTGARK